MLNTVLVIISLNLGVFIAVQISPGLVADLGLWSPVKIFFEQPWGIVTSMFVHDGFFHLFANMITLFFFGSFLNRLLDGSRLLLIYFGGGLLGNIFFVLLGTLLNPDLLALAVGASGAVFALGGALTILRPNLRVFIFPIPAPIPIWIAVIGGFIILSFLPYVAWQAHLGGLLFGLAVGYFIKRRGRYYY